MPVRLILFFLLLASVFLLWPRSQSAAGFRLCQGNPPAVLTPDLVAQLAKLEYGTKAADIDAYLSAKMQVKDARWCRFDPVRVNFKQPSTAVVYAIPNDQIVLLYEDGLLLGNSAQSPKPTPDYQNFEPVLVPNTGQEISSGQKLGQATVASSIGEIALKGAVQLKAPAPGFLLQDSAGCGYFFATKLPGYAMRICFAKIKPGQKSIGDLLADGDSMTLSLLWRQKDGKFLIVPPAKEYVQAFLIN
jgi:hypothetical protein